MASREGPTRACLFLLPLTSSLLLLSGCQFTPLMNRIAVGEEPIVVFVAEAGDGSTDLFAVSPGGGPVHQLTFNRPVESHPALAPGGTMVAFLRQPLRGDSSSRQVIVMNLLNASERDVPLPAEAGAPLRLAWEAGQSALVVATDRGAWQVAAPPGRGTARRLDGPDRARADTLLGVGVGDPVFALVTACGNGGICARGPGGEEQLLAVRGEMPFRWGADSLAWFDQDRIEVRPLGAGRTRQVMWTRAPRNPRQATYAAPPRPEGAGETGLVVP